MTQAHPNILGALAALHSLAEAWPWLADMLEPGTPLRTSRVLGAGARANINRAAKAERADLVETFKRGGYPTGTGRSPLVTRILDAQTAAASTVLDAAWVVSSALRLLPRRWCVAADSTTTLFAFTPGSHGDGHRFAASVDYLRVALWLVPPDLAGQVGRELDKADSAVRAACGVAPDRRRFGQQSCPACGRRSLIIRTLGTDDAAIECDRPDCRCRGIDCLCRRPQRTPGLKHLWPASEFGQLDRLLSRTAA